MTKKSFKFSNLYDSLVRLGHEKAPRALLIMTGFLFGASSFAGNYKMGNYDLQGSRSIPSLLEPNLTKSNVKAKGLEVKWFAPTDFPVSGVPVVYKGVTFVGTTDLGGHGSIYAFDAVSGAQKWSVPVAGGVLASPLIYKGKLYVASLFGVLYRMDTDGNILNAYAPGLTSFDTIMSGPIPVFDGLKDRIVIALNPQDEYGSPEFGISAVISVDADTLDHVWTQVITEPGQGGSGIWGTAPAYSIAHGLIYVGTGQTTINTLPTLPTTSNAIYAIDVRSGDVAWKTQVRNDDIWNFLTPFDPLNPKDTDIGDAPALFFQGAKQYVAAGSKRGYFYVMDALTGEITNKKVVNGSDTDNLGFKRALDAFNYSGSGVIGNSADGGYNLDSGYFRNSSGLFHFGTLFDYKAALSQVEKAQSPWVNGTCYIAGFGFPEECPPVSTGHLILNSGDGKKEIGRFSKDGARLFSPLYVNDVVFATSTNNESAYPPYQTPLSIIAIDVSNPAKPKLMADIPLAFNGVNAASGGSMVSISNGMIFAGNGFFGGNPGLYGIGLKSYTPITIDDN